MSARYRRFEILLPLRFNDGQPVPGELFADTIIQLREQFGAVSAETQTIRGQWQHQGEVFRDDLVRLFVDVADTAKNRRYFMRLKEVLKQRFRQIDLWVTSGYELPHRRTLNPGEMRRPQRCFRTRRTGRSQRSATGVELVPPEASCCARRWIPERLDALPTATSFSPC